MNIQLVMVVQENFNSTDYIIALVISLLILGYLIYALIKPEKF